MKRLIRSIVVLTLVFAFSVTSALNVKAEGRMQMAPKDFGDPINVLTYEEDGCTVTERLYFCPDQGLARGKSGSGWYKNEKTVEWKSGNESTYYAQGYFEWGDGEVSVSSPSGNVTNVPSGITISNKDVSSGTGKYAYVFNNFAYVTFSFTETTRLSGSVDYSVTIRISESGNAI